MKVKMTNKGTIQSVLKTIENKKIKYPFKSQYYISISNKI